MIATTVLTLVLTCQQIGVPPAGPPMQSRDLLSVPPGSAQSVELQLDAIRMARLARLDQLLALTESQRENILRVLREDIRKPFSEPTARVGTLLRPERLEPVLTVEQRRVFNQWREQAPVRKTIDAMSCKDAAKLLATRVSEELKCSPAQRRRLEVAASGLAIRFMKSRRNDQPYLTRHMLIEDGTYVPLLEETPFWSKAVAATLSADQQEMAKQFRKRRTHFYANANATIMVVDLESALKLTRPEVAKLRVFLAEELATLRPMFPFRELTNPLLNLDSQRLKDIVTPDHARQLISIGSEERKRIEKLVKAAGSKSQKAG